MIQSEFIGGRELLEALKALREGVAGDKSNLVKNALNAAGRDVLEDVKTAAPEVTGRLKNAIKKQVHPRPEHLNEIIGIGVDLGNSRDDPNGAWYARIVEFNLDNKGKSFLRRPFEAKRQKNLNTVRKSLATGIERVGKKVGNKNAAAVGAKIKRL
jgi:hypothetical protein